MKSTDSLLDSFLHGERTLVYSVFLQEAENFIYINTEDTVNDTLQKV